MTEVFWDDAMTGKAKPLLTNSVRSYSCLKVHNNQYSIQFLVLTCILDCIRAFATSRKPEIHINHLLISMLVFYIHSGFKTTRRFCLQLFLPKVSVRASSRGFFLSRLKWPASNNGALNLNLPRTSGTDTANLLLLYTSLFCRVFGV